MKQGPHFLFYLIAAVPMALILFNPEIVFGMEGVIASIGFLLILVLSFWGIFEEQLWIYSLFACLVQLGYFLVDAGTSLFIGKSVWYALPQFISFALTGLMFVYIIALAQKNFKAVKVSDLHGLVESNKLIGIGLIVALLAFGGMPGFNIFVGEYLIYSMLFELNPLFAMLAVFASLIAFIFYFRLVFIAFLGEKRKLHTEIISNALVIVLSFLTILLGIIPFILFKAIELFAGV